MGQLGTEGRAKPLTLINKSPDLFQWASLASIGVSKTLNQIPFNMCLFGLMLNVQINSYANVGMVSLHNLTCFPGQA